MSGDEFEHNGQRFRVLSHSPERDDLFSGMWLRIQYDPNSGHSDLVGKITDVRTFSPNSSGGYGRQEVRIDLSRTGDDTPDCYQFLSDGFIEVIEPLELATAAEPGTFNRIGGRNIVVCFDGTKNQNESQNTNVHRIYELADTNFCIKNYYSGVGVGGRPIGNLMDRATGRGAFRTVRAAYTFVRGNFINGDKIFIFGFSRGAFAARHLAGWIARMGIHHHTENGYDKYRESLLTDWPNKSYDDKHNVEFLGLFDCVPGNQLYALRSSARSTNNPVLEAHIRNFAHCVATDERRWSFRPLIFERTKQLSFEQVWFPGYHFDVGGEGNPPLNDFARNWMLMEAAKRGLKLQAPVPALDFPTADGICSDWRTTKLGLKYDRKKLKSSKWIKSYPAVSATHPSRIP